MQKNVLIYHKRPIKKMLAECIKILESEGFNVETIFYGKYTINEYKDALNRNNFLIHFVEQESQGISLAEAWSMDVPTIVWNPGYYHFENGSNKYSSSSPYLSNKTGLFFNNSIDFEYLIKNNLTDCAFSPREWVINNMSDEICASKLVEIITRKSNIL